MVESRLQTNREICYLCGKPMVRSEKHHCLNGLGYRDKSEADGLFCFVHPQCHKYIHSHPMTARTLKMRSQCVFEAEIGSREEFIKRYGKSYL